ncbi:leucine-rich repeat domain-containing protein [Candidatus Poribacteria bacterium]|nr:leucine-rich repeat domain-containing protein [Candidatus Poribacteria bacterium]
MNTLTPDALKAYRTENDLSQDEFGKRAGIVPSTISRFESGAGNLSEETETKVLEFMNQTTQEKSATPVTLENTSIENIIDESRINTTTNQIIEKLITRKKEFTNKVKSTVRDHLSQIKRSCKWSGASRKKEAGFPTKHRRLERKPEESMKRILSFCLAFLLLCSRAVAQESWMPDPRLREAVREALGFQSDEPFTRDDLLQLDRLDLWRLDVEDLTGIEHATNLTWFSFAENDVADLSPLADLTALETLYGWSNRQIVDISSIANLTALRTLNLAACNISEINALADLTALENLNLGYNKIENIGPLANLKQLTELRLMANKIVDIRPLTHLTHLKTLWIADNLITDYRPIQALDILELIRDEVCDFPDGLTTPGLRERIENRKYPSVFQAWSRISNRPELSYEEGVGLHDLFWSCCTQFGLRWRQTENGVKLVGNLEKARAEREALLRENPNLILLPQIFMRDAFPSDFYHENWPYWITDASGNRVLDPGYPAYLMDFTHPQVIDLIVKQVIETKRCGLYDGIMLDFWNERYPVLRIDWSQSGYRGDAAEQRARDAIITRIREAVGDDFLIIVNTNRRKPMRAAPYVNGLFMETLRDNDSGYTHEGLREIESTLLWAEKNLREPQINCLEGWGIVSQSPASPNNRRWMRVFTTMSLTHSDGYVLYNDGIDHTHDWYDFYDADLGRPIGPKAETYRNIDGLFIREFDHGWAVYNRSGRERTVQLREKVSGVASGVENERSHTIPDLDGEIYLKTVEVSNPLDVNGDGSVNILDLVIVANALGKDAPDVNGDGTVNVLDLVVVANAFQ